MGTESYFIDYIEKELYNSVVSEDERAFNQSILYGKDTTIDQILDTAKRFPMMAEYQLVIVREAQELSRVIDKLESYISNSQTSTVLVICYKYKSIDKRKKLYKTLQQHASRFGLMLDMRNHYESEIGHFEGAITPDVDTFRDSLPLIEKDLHAALHPKAWRVCD